MILLKTCSALEVTFCVYREYTWRVGERGSRVVKSGGFVDGCGNLKAIGPFDDVTPSLFEEKILTGRQRDGRADFRACQEAIRMN